MQNDMKTLSINRIEPTLAKITCEGGKVRDIVTGKVFSEVIASCKAWQSDEQVLAGYEAV